MTAQDVFVASFMGCALAITVAALFFSSIVLFSRRGLNREGLVMLFTSCGVGLLGVYAFVELISAR